MNDEQFNELAGRIQGLADFVLHLTAMLEMANVIDGSHFTESLHRYADGRCYQSDQASLEATKRMLHGLADALEQARQARQ